MKQLWAPWRMEFITGEKEAGCVFCTRLGRQQDREDLILHRGQNTFTLLNKFPYGNGHLMVVPHQHTDDLAKLDEATAVELISQIGVWRVILMETLKAEACNVGLNWGRAAGAGIEDHVHFHIVPRWIGDTNFMAVLTDTKVMPQALMETYDILKAAIPAGS